MSNIANIDARACGTGKTVDTIYRIIKECKNHNIPYLSIQSSINLQSQYKEDHEDLHVINYTGNETTTAMLVNAMSTGIKEISVTKQAHILSYNLSNKQKYACINDEGLDNLVTNIKLYTNEKGSPVHFMWYQHFDIVDEDKENMKIWLTEEKLSRTKFVKLKLISFCKNRILKNCQAYQQLINKNYEWYISPYNYKIMMDDPDNESFMLFGIINPSVITGFRSTHISSAAFENTMFNWWMQYHEVPFSINPLNNFKPHKGNIFIHYINDTWSKGKQDDKENSNLSQFQRYVDNSVGQNPAIVLRNNVKNKKPRYQNEILVNHNAHGLNDPMLQQCRHVVIESAINPHPELYSFFTEELLKNINGDKDYIITQMFSCVNFYQIIMRCFLRSRFYNGEEIHIYLMDKKVANAMTYYFENPKMVDIPFTREPRKKDPVVERARYQVKLNKKENQLEDLIIAIGNRAMTGSERIKKMRLTTDIKKLQDILDTV